jgi:hypothetical protein
LTKSETRVIFFNPQMNKTNKKPKQHCYIFKAAWRGTALKLRIEANDLEYAYRIAENMVRRMEGGASCLSVECIKQEY